MAQRVSPSASVNTATLALKAPDALDAEGLEARDWTAEALRACLERNLELLWECWEHVALEEILAPDGGNLLSVAAAHGSDEILDWLLATPQPPSLSHRDQAGLTPLLIAAKNGQTDCIDAFMPFLAPEDHAARDADGLCALEILLMKASFERSMHSAADFMFFRQAIFLLEPRQGAMVSAQSWERHAFTCLEWDDPGLLGLKLAIAHCPQSVHTRKMRQITLLCEAIRHAPPETVLWLLSQGADPEAKGLFGAPPLAAALSLPLRPQKLETMRESIKAFLPHCDPRARTAEGKTALMNAVKSDNLEFVRLLLPHSDANARSLAGEWALSIAVDLHLLDAARILAPATDLALRDADGATVMDRAFTAERWDMVDALASGLPSDQQETILIRLAQRFLPQTAMQAEAALLARAATNALAEKKQPSPAKRL